MKQTSFFKQPMEFGGELLRGKRKTMRPLSSQKPMHFVFKSGLAIGVRSFRKKSNLELVEKNLKYWSKYFGITLYQYSVNNDHIHIAAKGSSRTLLQNFLRVFSGQVAQDLLKIWRVPPQRVWTSRVYSRVCEWGRAFRTLLAYVVKNQLESEGKIPYTPRRRSKRLERLVSS